MELTLTEYRVTRPLRDSGRSRVFEAVAESDGREVIAKVFDIGDETVEARVQHEFELIRALDIEGVVRAEALQRVGDQLVLILERAPGVDLQELAAGQALALPRFWQIADQITDILARTHARRVIHRDIKPANLLFDVASGRAHVADFGISVLLENERRHIYDDQVLIGTLSYISPEQTGRTKRSVDFRSDLYSLGVTFYELLTGARPFDSPTPLELIHAHLARTPRAPIELRPELPNNLSRLVMKLLAKAPEHRYQTAAGLGADLRELQRLHEAGLPERTFALGLEDRATELQLPHQLYGRETEQTELREELEQLIASKTRATTLLAGPAGVGKSALLDALEVVAVGHGAQVLHGKFDPYRELPYSAFVAAFAGLFEQLLTESDARLAAWRRRLELGLGGLVDVVCELIPTLALIVGPRQTPAELEPIQARNRLQVAMDRLILTLSEDSMVVFRLDDLHHADHGSVALLETLVRGVQGPVLITGTLRVSEVADDHPLRALLDTIGGSSLPHARVLPIEPLSASAIESLLRDAFGGTPDPLPTLAAIVTRKTGGVPLFVGQFLSQLVSDQILRAEAEGWRWDNSAVELTRIPDDAVAMMRAKLETLPRAARELLGCAACLGTRFGLAELTLVSGRDQSDVVASAFELIEAGLLVDAGREYRFNHDSIQSAAQQQLPADARRGVHWKIGRHLLETLARPALDEQLFDIAEHLAAGAPDQLEPATRVEIATLNLRAGRRAIDSASYVLALRYLDHGLALLGQADAGAHGELGFGLSFGRAQALALANRRDLANTAFDELLGRALEDHQFGLVVARRIRLLQLDNRQDEAVALGRAALARLRAPLPRMSRARALTSLTRAWLMVRGLELDAAMAIPACEDPRSAALVEIVAQLKYPAFIADQDLFMYLSGLHVRMLGELGFHETTPVAIGDLSISVSGGLDKTDDADHMLTLARSLCVRVARPEIARSNIIALGGTLCWHRTRPYSEFMAEFEQGYPVALEQGEFDHAAFMAAFAADMQLETDVHLAVLNRRARELELDVGRRGVKQMEVLTWILGNVCAALLGARDEAPDDAPSRGLEPLTSEAIYARGGVPTNEYMAYTNIAMVQLVLGDRGAAVETCMRAAPRVGEVLFASWLIGRLSSVACVAVYAHRLLGRQLPPGAEAMARKCLRRLRSWAKAGPDNYAHHLELALGLREAARGRLARALTHLDRAWVHAGARGCRWVEGLAAEYAAMLFERQDSAVAVEGTWRRAWDAFSAWGAEAKLERLRAARPALFVDPERRRGTLTTSSSKPGTSLVQSLDLEGVLRSVSAITGELQLDEVVTRVLDAALTNAGADHGVLLLERGGELRLVAEAGGGDDPHGVLEHPPTLGEAGDLAPTTIVNYVVRTGKSLVLDDASSDPRFAVDPYLARHEVRSLLALPIVRNGLLGVLVLDNSLSTHWFTSESIETLRMITSQAASTLDNARLYAALGRSEARWRSLVDGAPDLIALLDERGQLVFVNRGDDGRGASFIAAMTTSSRARWELAVQQVLDGGHQRELELELDEPGGSRWYAVRVAPIELDDDQRPELAPDRRRNAVAIATDVTDRKRADAERADLEIQLRQQQRLESLGTLASGVAHEINNPIQGIMNYAELISASADDRETVIEFAGEIAHETERVATIVRNLLAFSRREPGHKLEDVDTRALIEGTLSLVKSVLRKDRIRLELELQALPVRCHVQQIQQILMNLMTNARDALNDCYPDDPTRKRLAIRVSPLDAGRVRVTVEDNAGGIPEGVLAHIFDPFFTTKGRDQGTGLGLSVSHGIAQEHGGDLSVETRVGEGTCFHLDLPGAR